MNKRNIIIFVSLILVISFIGFFIFRKKKNLGVFNPNNLLHLSQEVRDHFGEHGMFPQSKESPTWQVIVCSGLKERNWLVNNWVGKKITAKNLLTGKVKTIDYSKHNSMNANKAFKMFGK